MSIVHIFSTRRHPHSLHSHAPPPEILPLLSHDSHDSIPFPHDSIPIDSFILHTWTRTRTHRHTPPTPPPHLFSLGLLPFTIIWPSKLSRPSIIHHPSFPFSLQQQPRSQSFPPLSLLLSLSFSATQTRLALYSSTPSRLPSAVLLILVVVTCFLPVCIESRVPGFLQNPTQPLA
jgi:hypothetical protein